MSAARDFRINSETVKVLLEECGATDPNQVVLCCFIDFCPRPKCLPNGNTFYTE